VLKEKLKTADFFDYDIQHYEESLTLRDGRQVCIRAIHRDDKNALQAFHSRLSDESLFLRYHYSKGSLTESDLKNFCDIDYHDNLGLVVEKKESNNQTAIIGVGRYCRLPGTDIAEVAFVVEDDEQRKGIGTHLLRHLARLAWQQGIHYFFGEVLRQNGKMLSIFRKSDPSLKQVVDDHTTCTITLSVAEAMQPGPQ
jgi:GNAT superfamily N-acetyltransferase